MEKTNAVAEYTHSARFLTQEALKDLFLNTGVAVTNAALQSLYVLPGDFPNPVIYGDAEFIAVFTGRVQFMKSIVEYGDHEECFTRECYSILPAVEHEESDVVLQYEQGSQDVTNWTPWLTLEQLRQTEIKKQKPYSEDEGVQLLYDRMNAVETKVEVKSLNNHIPVALLVFILPMPKTLPPPLSPEEADEHDSSKRVYPKYEREITEETCADQVITDKLFIAVTCSLQDSQDFFSSFNSEEHEALYERHCHDLSYYLECSIEDKIQTAGITL